MKPIGAHGGEVVNFVSFCFRGEFGFLNCDDIIIIIIIYLKSNIQCI